MGQMSSALLNAKMHIPRARPDLVLRSRLTERLQADAWRPFNLISAPAGFGKTTLVSEWVRANEWPSVWISLDEGDNDLSRFLSYFITALQSINIDIGKAALGALQASESPPTEAILIDILNGITAVSDDFILVLDDYHVITAQPIHDAVSFLLGHVTPQMHLVVCTRADPPLAVSRLRARGQMAELRAADLRFTHDEAETFLSTSMRSETGSDLSSEAILALENRTEGWIAGLQIAVLSMQERGDKHEFIEAFTGSQRHILDYLTAEVLQQQPEHIQAFLLQTSILSQLTGPLCNAVTGQGEGQAILEQLEAANLFLVPLDDERRWYRYHHLFSNVLQHYLEREVKEHDVTLLHQRASDWYANNGLLDEALEHALTAADSDRAADLVERHANSLLKRGQLGIVLRWFAELPPEVIRRRARLSLIYALTLMVNLQMGDVEPYLRDADKALEAAPDSELLGVLCAIRGFIARISEDIPRGVELNQRARLLMREDTWGVLSMVAWNSGMSSALTDDLPGASRAFVEAQSIANESDHTLFYLYATCWLAQAYEWQGNLYQAAETYQQALQVVIERESRGESIPLTVGMVYAGLSLIWLEWNDLGKATELAFKAIELGELGGPMDNFMRGYLALARTKQAQGDVAGSLEELEEVEQIFRRSTVPQWVSGITPYRVRLSISQSISNSADGLPPVAIRWLQSSGLLEDSRQPASVMFLPSHPRDFEHLTLARIFLVQGKVDEAFELLDWLHQSAATAGRTRSVIEILMLKSLAWQTYGDTSRAVSALEEAIKLAEPEGYIRLFADEGPMLAELLRRAYASGISSNYVSKLMAACGVDPDLRTQLKGAGVISAITLPEPISDRELEILNLISQGISNRDAAEHFVVATSTVKKHLENIYGKLGVHNRTQAVARARELSLL